MGLFTQIFETNHTAAMHFENADLMRTYKNVTDTHGPSQALIDFINKDKTFGAEIGLEKFENFSTPVQHEIMLSKMEPELVESMAMEGFVDFLKKYRHWLAVGSILTGFVIPPLWIGAIVGYVADAKEIMVPKYSEFVALKKVYLEVASIASNLMTSTPSGTSPESWSKFKEETDDAKDKLAVIEDRETFAAVKMAVSDWSPTKFKDSAEFLNDQHNKLKSAIDAYEKKVASVSSVSDSSEDGEKASLVKNINSSMGVTSKALHEAKSHAEKLKMILNHVSKAFEFEKNDK